MTLWDSGVDPPTRGQPHRPRGAPVCPCASVSGAWELLAQLSSIEILSLAPLHLPSPPPGVTPSGPSYVVLESGLLREGGRAGLRDAVRAGAGAGASLPALAGFNPSCWAAVPGALGSEGPRNGMSRPSSQEGPWDWMTSAPSGSGPGQGRLSGAGTGVDTATEVSPPGHTLPWAGAVFRGPFPLGSPGASPRELET